MYSRRDVIAMQSHRDVNSLMMASIKWP